MPPPTAPRPGPPPRRIDLHGLSRDQARRRAVQELHASRVRGEARLVLITGRGHGSRTGEPLLRDALETFLRDGPGRGLGVTNVVRVDRGGALQVDLSLPGQR